MYRVVVVVVGLFVHTYVAARIVSAQSLTMVGANSGYFLDSSGFHLIAGIPGSAWIGRSLSRDFTTGSVAPNRVSALTTQHGTLQFIADLGTMVAIPLEGAVSKPTSILWASDSSSAALFSRPARSFHDFRIPNRGCASKLQFVTHLTASPLVEPEIDIPSIPASCTLLAANPSAHLAVIAAVEGGISVLYLVGNASPIRIPVPGEIITAATFSKTGDLYAAGAGQLWRIAGPIESHSPVLLLDEGTGDPVAIRVVESYSLLIIADYSSRKLRLYDSTSTQKVDEFELAYSPSNLDAIGSSYFLILGNRASGVPLLVLHTGSRSLLFIPQENDAQ